MVEVAALELASLARAEGVLVVVAANELLVATLEALGVVTPFVIGSVQLVMPADDNQGAATKVATFSIREHRRPRALDTNIMRSEHRAVTAATQLVKTLVSAGDERSARARVYFWRVAR